LETAKENLPAVLRTDPDNQAAQYYLHLVEETPAASFGKCGPASRLASDPASTTNILAG
jgi:hypothetical protein